MTNNSTQLDPTLRRTKCSEFETALRSKVVGQDEAVGVLVDLFHVRCAKMRAVRRPVGNCLFLGPTGSGKTRMVEAAAEILFGDPRAVIKLICGYFQHATNHISSFGTISHPQVEAALLAI